MASTADIIPRYLVDPCGGPICFTVETQGPGFLKLVWSLFPPKLTQKYRTVRGVRAPCGFTYQLPYNQCLPQQEIGQTTTHTFCLPPIVLGQTIYYTLTKSCIFRDKVAQSPPQEYTFVDCVGGVQAWKCESTSFGNVPLAPGWASPAWTHIIYDPDNCLPTTPFGQPRLCSPGVWEVRVDLTFRMFPGTAGGVAFVQVVTDGREYTMGIHTVPPDVQVSGSFLKTVFPLNPGSPTLIIRVQNQGSGLLQLIGTTTRHWASAQ